MNTFTISYKFVSGACSSSDSEPGRFANQTHYQVNPTILLFKNIDRLVPMDRRKTDRRMIISNT